MGPFPAMRKKTNKGQALVEAVVIAPLLFAFVFFLGLSVFELLSRILISHMADKALICETTDSSSNCQTEFRKRLLQFSQSLKIQKYAVTKTSQNYNLDLEISLPLSRRLLLQKDLPWNHQGPHL